MYAVTQYPDNNKLGIPNYAYVNAAIILSI